MQWSFKKYYNYDSTNSKFLNSYQQVPPPHVQRGRGWLQTCGSQLQQHSRLITVTVVTELPGKWLE